jgi:hypothetical protein
METTKTITRNLKAGKTPKKATIKSSDKTQIWARKWVNAALLFLLTSNLKI